MPKDKDLMSILDWNLRSTFDAEYQVGIGYKRPEWSAEPRLNYARVIFYPTAEKFAAAYAAILSITAADTVVIIGSGFGWSAEALEILTGCDAIGVDTSTWINANKGLTEDTDIDAALATAGVPTNDRAAVKAELVARGRGPGARARVPIANEALGNNGSRNRVRGLFSSGRVEVVISEFVLETMTDTEITDALGRFGALVDGSRVAHLVTTTEITGGQTPAGYNWKSLAEWRSFLNARGAASHVLIETSSFRSA